MSAVLLGDVATSFLECLEEFCGTFHPTEDELDEFIARKIPPPVNPIILH
jgi:hypothetical protein